MQLGNLEIQTGSTAHLPDLAMEGANCMPLARIGRDSHITLRACALCELSLWQLHITAPCLEHSPSNQISRVGTVGAVLA